MNRNGPAVGQVVIWMLVVSGWLVIGALGQRFALRWAGGLLPVALWLAAAGIAQAVFCGLRIGSAALRVVLAVSGVSTGASLMVTAAGQPAALAVATCWGVLLAAASLSLRMRRARCAPSRMSLWPAAIGTSVAWCVAADASVLPGPVIVVVPMLAAFLLTWRLPSFAHVPAGDGRNVLRGTTWALPDPSTWGTLSARWTMLPMMATLTVMSQWCGGGAGLTPSEGVGIHLAAMFAAPLLLDRMRVRPRAGWATAAMCFGLVPLCAMPDLRGIMLASLCQSVAWGLAWSATATRTSSQARAAGGLPALFVMLLGVAVGTSGPVAIGVLQTGLGLFAVVGAVALVGRRCRALFDVRASSAVGAFHRTQRRQRIASL